MRWGGSVSTDAVSGQADAFRQAAEAGDAEAMWQYAVTLLGLTMAPPGPGTTLFPQLRAVATVLEGPGHQDARGWVQRSAAAANTHAMVVEAALLERVDRQRAEQLAGQAADRGDTAAMAYLAGLLAGDGDRVAARYWYAKLADLGDHAAMALFGEMMLEEDPQLARIWLRRAADAGSVQARNDLARLPARESGLAVAKTRRGRKTSTFVTQRGNRRIAGIAGVAAAAIAIAVIAAQSYNGVLFKILWAVGWALFAAFFVRYGLVRVQVRGGKLIVRNPFRTRTVKASEIRGISWLWYRTTSGGGLASPGHRVDVYTPRVHLAGGGRITLYALRSADGAYTGAVAEILSLLGVQLPDQEQSVDSPRIVTLIRSIVRRNSQAQPRPQPPSRRD
jgi:TPR repeat protein